MSWNREGSSTSSKPAAISLSLGFGRILDQEVEIAERAQSGIGYRAARTGPFIGITSPS